MTKPFRWDIARREQLGRLVHQETNEPLPELFDFLRQCSARIIAFSGDANLIFIGRSPENIFDYLSGVLATTSWADRCRLINISLRLETRSTLQEEYPYAIKEGRQLFAEYDLSPEQVLQDSRPIAFVDFVASGETFGRIAELLMDWAEDCHLNLASFRKKLRFIGITRRTKTSPNTWRWQQNVAWTKAFSPSQIKNVSIESSRWNLMGNYDPKVSLSNPPWRWGKDDLLYPSRENDQLAALNLALFIYDTGNSVDERLAFAKCLATAPGMRHSWYRELITELRRLA
jgi:hypothetical protein